MRKKRIAGVGRRLFLAAVAAALLIWLGTALSGVERGRREEGRRRLETALRRASVSCYATEGIYPPDLDYLTERYGVRIDAARYDVFYEVFADNLMPDITVVERTP